MRRRRMLAATFALIALAFSLVETARAAACGEPLSAVSHEQHGVPAPTSEQPTHNETMPECPLGMAWQVGCAPAASLPTQQAYGIAAAWSTASVAAGDVVIPNGISSAAIFHPPRI